MNKYFFFFGHDPGAKNHIRPIFEHLLSLDYSAIFFDLSKDHNKTFIVNSIKELSNLNEIYIITGLSVNKQELYYFENLSFKKFKKILVVEIAIGSKLGKDFNLSIPDYYFVTNQKSFDELVNLGIKKNKISITGSTHCEKLYHQKKKKIFLNDIYNIPDCKHEIISLFGNPSFDLTEKGLLSFFRKIEFIDNINLWFVVRPHPRMPNKIKLKDILFDINNLTIDDEYKVETHLLIMNSLFTLSLTSTTSVESLLLGTPSAFYQLDWDYKDIDNLYINLDPIPRIRSVLDLENFVNDVLNNNFSFNTTKMENWDGALKRSITSIMSITKT